MKSPFTGNEMKQIVEKRIQSFRKEDFEIYFHCYQCDDTEEKFESQEQAEINYNQVIDQFRVKHQIPFPEEMIAIRTSYGISARMMSQVLGFGINMYNKYENGEIPSISNGITIRLAANPNAFESLVTRCPYLDEDKKSSLYKRIMQNKNVVDNPILLFCTTQIPTQTNGYKAFDLCKFQNMVKYFAERLTPFKVKLNKLLFYADFEHFRRFGRGISGVEYQAIQMGPVPHNFQILFQMVQQTNIIEIVEILFDEGVVGEKFVSVGDKFNKEVFSPHEMSILESVATHFERITTTNIIELSHQENAWKAHEENRELIPYSYAFELQNLS